MSDRYPEGDEGVHAIAALYAVDALEPAERAIFESHLDGCSRCQGEIAGYAQVGAHLAEAVAQAPPPALREAVLGAIGATSSMRAVAPAPAHTATRSTTGHVAGPAGRSTIHTGAEIIVSLEDRRRRRTRRLAAAAAAVLAPGLALSGWGLGVQSEQRQQQQLTAQQTAVEDRLLAAPDVTTHRILVQGRPATLLVSQQQDAALFVSTDLPDPGHGREYQLWLIRNDTPIPDVHFTVGQARIWLDGDIAAAQAVAMTNEPAGGSSTPTLPVLAATEI